MNLFSFKTILKGNKSPDIRSKQIKFHTLKVVSERVREGGRPASDTSIEESRSKRPRIEAEIGKPRTETKWRRARPPGCRVCGNIRLVPSM